jgi:hypothetical protein
MIPLFAIVHPPLQPSMILKTKAFFERRGLFAFFLDISQK